MNQAEIIEYSKAMGAHVTVKKVDGPGIETISIFVGSKPAKPRLGIQGWEHALFLNQSGSLWKIGFSQAGSTRALNETEIKYVLRSWVKNPNDEIFKKYETT